MAETNELITWLGFKFKPDSKKNLEQADAAIEKIKSGVKAIGTFFLGASGAIGYFTNTVMGGAQELVNLSKTTGIAIENLERWQYVATSTGVSFEALTGDLENFKKMGMDVVSLSKQFASAGARSAILMKQRWGISDDMFQILRQGPDAVNKLMDEAYIIPGKSIQQTAEFTKKLNAAKATLISMKNEIFMSVSPALVNLVEKFKDWMQQNKELIKSKLAEVIKGVALGFERFVKIASKAWQVLEKIAEYFGILGENGDAVETVANVITGALLLWTGGKVIAGLSTLVTLMQGFVGLMTANVSIGATIASWNAALVPFLATVAALVVELKVLKDVYDTLKSFWEKGVSQTVDDIKKNTKWYEYLYNPVKLAAVGGAAIGESIGDLASMITNSNNVINMQVTPEQASSIIKDVTGGNVDVSTVPFPA